MPLYRLPTVHRGALPDREIQHWVEADTVVIRLGSGFTRREQDQQIVRIVREHSRRDAMPLVLGLPLARQADKAKENPAVAGTGLLAAIVLVAAGLAAFNETSKPNSPAGGHPYAAPARTSQGRPAPTAPGPAPARQHPSPQPSASSTGLERAVTIPTTGHAVPRSPVPRPTAPPPPRATPPPHKPAPPSRPSPSPRPGCVTITLVIARAGLCL